MLYNDQTGAALICVKEGEKLIWAKKPPSLEPWYYSDNWDSKTALPLEPSCTDQFPLRQIPGAMVSLNRLGFTQYDSHAMPVPHHNVDTGSLIGTGRKDENGHLLASERVDISSPVDLTILGLASNTYSRSPATNEVFSYTEWMIAAHVCGTKYLSFAHVDDIPPSWLQAIEAPGVVKGCGTGQDNAAGCAYTSLNIPVKQGARLGRSSGRSGGWDIGGWDTSRPTPGVLDPGKYTGRWAMGVCVWDWFTPAIKSQVFALFNGDKTSCGTHGQDVANSLSGVWLAVGKRSEASREALHVALIANPRNDGTYRISIGPDSGIPSLPGGTYEFRAATSGLVNSTFAAVGPGQVACFDSFDNRSSVTRIFAKMSAGATENLSIAGDSGGVCGQGPYAMPSGAVTFERSTKTSG